MGFDRITITIPHWSIEEKPSVILNSSIIAMQVQQNTRQKCRLNNNNSVALMLQYSTLHCMYGYVYLS